jgi:CRP/FNR family transcriptional regulator, cyclic AMP receptor protein
MADSTSAISLGILSRSRVFQAAPVAELERLAPRCMFQRYRPGAEIAYRGAPGDALGVIGRGCAKGTLPSPSANGELIVAIFVPGEVFGEAPLFDARPRAVTVTAITECEVAFVPKAELVPLLERRPGVAMRLLEAVCDKLRGALDLSLSIRFLDLPSRFYQRLLYLSRYDSAQDGNGVRIHHGLSQQELADSIGATREALNKLISEWKRGGLLDYGRGYVVVRDPAALSQRLPAAIRHDSIFGNQEIGQGQVPEPSGKTRS